MRAYKDIHAKFGPVPGPCWFKVFDPTKDIRNHESGIEYYMHTWQDLFHKMQFMYERSLKVPTLGGLQVRTGVLTDSRAVDQHGTPAAVVLTWVFGRASKPIFKPSVMKNRVAYESAYSLPLSIPFPSPPTAYGAVSMPVYQRVYEKFMHDAEIPSWFFMPDGLTDACGWCPPLRYSDKRWRYALGETPAHMDELYGRPPMTTTSWEDLL